MMGPQCLTWSAAAFAATVAQVFVAPTNFTEAGGAYRGLDNAVHSTGGAFTYFTDFRCDGRVVCVHGRR
jgi:hypothetical protein